MSRHPTKAYAAGLDPHPRPLSSRGLPHSLNSHPQLRFVEGDALAARTAVDSTHVMTLHHAFLAPRPFDRERPSLGVSLGPGHVPASPGPQWHPRRSQPDPDPGARLENAPAGLRAWAGYLCLCLLVLSTLSACARSRDAGEAPEARIRAPTIDSSHTQGSNSHLQRQLTERVRTHAREVAQLRGLELRHPLRVEFIDRRGVRDYVLKTLHRELSPELIAIMGRIDISMGVVGPTVDSAQVLLALLEDGIMGIYDPPTDTMLINDEVESSMMTMVLRHEVAHGIQDMHHDLDAINKVHLGHSDLDAARSWLVEGEAQAIAIGLEIGDPTLKSIPDRYIDYMISASLDASSLPPEQRVLARSMQLPYTAGMAAVVTLVRAGGWDAVDQLYAALPNSTEQMLHPEKLAARERPQKIALRSGAIEQVFVDRRVIWEDEFGEAAWLALLCESAPIPEARGAAAGWDGDRYIALAPHDDDETRPPLIVGLSHWDTREDAQEFASALRSYFGFEQRVPGASVVQRGQRVVYTTDGAMLPQSLDTLAGQIFSVAAPDPQTGGRAIP